MPAAFGWDEFGELPTLYAYRHLGEGYTYGAKIAVW